MATSNRRKLKLTHERLLELLSYDPDTGVWRWRVNRQPRITAGDVAGGVSKRWGYRVIGIDGYLYRSARLAWYYVNKEWPLCEVDHEDLVRDHDWFDNLRLASSSQNNANRRARRDNKSGLNGAYFINGKWRAYIRHGRAIYLGTFGSAEEAHAAYVAKAKELFGEFANSGA